MMRVYLCSRAPPVPGSLVDRLAQIRNAAPCAITDKREIDLVVLRDRRAQFAVARAVNAALLPRAGTSAMYGEDTVVPTECATIGVGDVDFISLDLASLDSSPESIRKQLCLLRREVVSEPASNGLLLWDQLGRQYPENFQISL